VANVSFDGAACWLAAVLAAFPDLRFGVQHLVAIPAEAAAG
jgi:predicted ester cyclase